MESVCISSCYLDHGNDFTFDVDCTTPGLFFTVVRNFKVDSRISPRIDVDYVCHDASGNQVLKH